MTFNRIGLSFSDTDLRRIDALRELIGVRSRSQAVSIAVQTALAIRSDPIAALAAAGVTFDAPVRLEIGGGRVRVYYPEEVRDVRISRDS